MIHSAAERIPLCYDAHCRRQDMAVPPPIPFAEYQPDMSKTDETAYHAPVLPEEGLPLPPHMRFSEMQFALVASLPLSVFPLILSVLFACLSALSAESPANRNFPDSAVVRRYWIPALDTSPHKLHRQVPSAAAVLPSLSRQFPEVFLPALQLPFFPATASVAISYVHNPASHAKHALQTPAVLFFFPVLPLPPAIPLAVLLLPSAYQNHFGGFPPDPIV